METNDHMTDAAALAALGERIAGHRLERNLTQAELAREAGISQRTLVRLEGGESTQLTNLVRVLRALGLLANLEAVVPPPLPNPLEQLRSREKRRKRASGHGDAAHDGGAQEWTWGDAKDADKGRETSS